MPNTILIPSQFRAETLFPIIKEKFGRLQDVPTEVTFDFSGLRFVRPSGVVFLSNLTKYLARHGCAVTYDNADPRRACIRFLDDSLFFEQHTGRKLSEYSSPRSTTRPLVEIRHTESHGWIGFEFIPWLSNCSGVPIEDLMELKTCLSEMCNNIADHTTMDVGSIFAQWFPKERQLEICLADFGAGIPANVSTVLSGLSDSMAISKAFEDGFTSKSLPTNQGAGLYYILQNVVESLNGMLTVQSSGGAVEINKVGNSVHKVPYDYEGFCPGTLIEMRFSTDLIETAGELEDFTW